MNSITTKAEGHSPGKTENLSRLHPRSSARPDEELESRSGRDLKTKESWVHTPAGLRPSPNASRSAEFPLATIPKVVVTKSKSAAQDSGPSIESPLPVSPDVPPIPAWLLAETTIAFKAGAVVLFLLGALIAFKFGEHRGRKVALPEIKPLLAAGPAAVHAPAGFPEDLLPALEAKAKQGDAEAQFELARDFLKGDGVTKDPVRAFELMSAAANQGHAEAMGGVGFFYANGIAVPKNEAKAVEWFRKGAEAGGAKAQLNLGKMLAEGKGVEKNESEGRKWIRAAADQEQPDAAYVMGTILYFGRFGQAVDYAAAYPYLLKAAESGHPDAQNTVGLMLEAGQGVELSAAQAEEWYRKAAKQGHTKAQSSLGRLIGPEVQDRPRRLEALTWLLVSAKTGEITAQKMLEEIEAGLKPDDLAQAQRLAGDVEKSLRASSSPK
jgi:TPR repeat protein